LLDNGLDSNSSNGAGKVAVSKSEIALAAAAAALLSAAAGSKTVNSAYMLSTAGCDMEFLGLAVGILGSDVRPNYIPSGAFAYMHLAKPKVKSVLLLFHCVFRVVLICITVFWCIC
jgi:hypothetical protein